MHKLKKSTHLALIVVVILSWHCTSSPYLHADDNVSDEARDQLISQAEIFRKESPPQKNPEEKPEIIEEKKKEEPAQAAGASFFVKKIDLEGNTIFSYDQLKKYLTPYEDQKVSFDNIKKVAQQITAHYRSKGFTTSRAYVPPQEITNNVVTINVVEGKVGRVFIENNRYFKNILYTDAIHIRRDRIFQYRDIETSLYYLNDKPDRKAKVYLMSGDQPSTSDLVLKAEEKNPLHMQYEFNNRGTTLTHHARHILSMTHNNLLGLGDTFNAGLAMAEEGAFTGGSFGYALPIEKTRTTLGLDASVSRSRIVKDLKPLDVKGQSWNITPSVTQNFVRSLRLSLDGFLGLEIKDSKTTISDSKINFDRMRVLKLGPRLTVRDAYGKTFVSGDFHVGIPNFLGSLDNNDPRASRNGTGGEFTYFTFRLSRVNRLPFSSFMVLRGNLQTTRDSLTSLEQYRLGGAYTVRGYPESSASGDYGFNFSSELNIPVPFVSQNSSIPKIKKRWVDALRLVGFIDGGKTYILERYAPTTEKDHFLLGAGFGLRVNLNEYFSVQSDFGFPIANDSEEDPMQVHLSVRCGF